VAVASAGQYADHLHLAPDNYHASTSPLVFTGRMPFLLPNKQRRSTEGINSVKTLKENAQHVVQVTCLLVVVVVVVLVVEFSSRHGCRGTGGGTDTTSTSWSLDHDSFSLAVAVDVLRSSSSTVTQYDITLM